MKLTLFTIQKHGNPHALALLEDFWQRLLQHKSALSLSAATRQNVKSEEELAKAIPPGAFLVLLDERGVQLSTQKLQQQWQQWAFSHPTLCLIIGGPHGFSKAWRERAHFLLSLSALTFPHWLVPVLLAEQLYRMATLAINHPYHHDE